MTRKWFNDFFGRLENEGIIREDQETGEIFIHPTVFYRGTMRNHDYDMSDVKHTRLFRKTIRDLYA